MFGIVSSDQYNTINFCIFLYLSPSLWHVWYHLILPGRNYRPKHIVNVVNKWI